MGRNTECQQCQVGNLKIHDRIPHGEKYYRCGQCSSPDKKATESKKHVRTHNREMPFNCSYAAAQRYLLIRHERTHTNVKTNKCRVLSYTIFQRFCLINHHNIQSGERPFTCELSSDKNVSDLQHHDPERSTLLIQNQAESEDNPLKCIISSKLFTKAQVFNKHLKSRDLDSGGKVSKRKSDLPDLAVSEKNAYRPGDLRGSFHDRE
ncbi:unnamed protein product [Allacma fusca]|uniref:C2H2-type domain-containing protein n=1 Tax=Allacma fusca TaxID=39272 RepID=A0A8J2PF68_9HEXA|nr:unnamed protein product [Allacma fusca]